MRADKADEDDARIIMDFYNESVVVALDVKNDAVNGKDVGRRIGIFDGRGREPCGFACLVKPGAE